MTAKTGIVEVTALAFLHLTVEKQKERSIFIMAPTLFTLAEIESARTSSNAFQTSLARA